MDTTPPSAHPGTADTVGHGLLTLAIWALLGSAGTLFYVWLIGGLHWVLACR